MSYPFIDFTYPNPQLINKILLWLDKNCNCYFGVKLLSTDSWTYYAGNASHALLTGKFLTSYGNTEANAVTNYLTTSKDSSGKVVCVLPANIQAKYVRVYVESGSAVGLREFRPSIYLTAHEIISGTLEITDLLSDAPLITVTASSIERIKIGKVGSAYGMFGYDASSNKIFELSDAAQTIAGYSFTNTALYSGAGVTRIQLDTSAGIHLGATAFADAPFRVSLAGAMVATSATITGTITSTSGTIGGFTLAANQLSSGTDADFVGLSSAGTNAIWVGDSTFVDAKFSVTATGVVKAISGTVGGWTLAATKLSAGTDADYIGLEPAAGIQLGDATFADAKFSVTPAGALKAISGTIGGCALGATSIGSTTFTSGPLGVGWNISNTGNAEFQNATIRGVIRTSVFEKDTISIVNGIVLISKGDVLAVDMTALDSSTLSISGETTFVANEIIRIKDGTDDEWMLCNTSTPASSITGTDSCYVDSTNTNAFLYIPGIDLSAYKGTDTGNALYKVTLTDNAGKKKIGYVAAEGSGLAYSAELLTSWTNNPDFPYETFTSSGANITSAVESSGPTNFGSANSNELTSDCVGKLYKFITTATINSGTSPYLWFDDEAGWIGSGGASISTGANSIYFTPTNVFSVLYLSLVAIEDVNFSFASTSMKQITEPSAASSGGVHIVSAVNGTTREWTSTESGFDDNQIAEYTVEICFPNTYNVTRDLAGSYSANANPIWKKGTAVASMGVGTGTKTGFITMDSSSTNSPFIDIYGRNSNTYTDYTLHARLGWLKGIVDADVGLNSTDVWGLYSDSVYLKGVIVANTGKIGGTSGWTIAAGKITSTGIGVATAAGDATYAFWAGNDTPASAEFSVTHAGALVATAATITGAVTASSGSIGSFTIGTYLYTGTKTAYNDANAGIHLGSDGIGIGNNVFTVSAAGALVATNATISGAISAATIDIGGADTTSFHVDTDGNMWSGAAAFANGVFKVGNTGVLTATGVTITDLDVYTTDNVSISMRRTTTSSPNAVAYVGSIITASGNVYTYPSYETFRVYTQFLGKAAKYAEDVRNAEFQVMGMAGDTSTDTINSLYNVTIGTYSANPIDCTINNYYGLNIEAAPNTAVVKWALYQSGSGDKNFFAGNIEIGDGKYFGLASTKGRIQFDDEATDYISFLDCSVGIGTATPSVKLEIAGDIKATGNILATSSNTNSTELDLINTSTGGRNWALVTWGSTAGGGTLVGGLSFYDNTSGGNRLGISSAGAVTMNAYGAGTATFDASGNITSVSDERMKNIKRPFLVGLREILKVQPIIYKWNKESKMECEHTYAGFSAQNIKKALGEICTGINSDEMLSIQDRAIMAVIVNSIKELANEKDILTKQLQQLTKKVAKLEGGE